MAVCLTILFICSLAMSVPAEAFRLFKIGESREVKMGQEVAESLEKEYGVEENARVAAIGQKVASKSDRSGVKCTFKVLKMKEPNAFACPGGFIYITRPLLDALKTDDALAAVLGHEIAHVAKRHSIKEYEKAMSAALLIQLGLMAVKANDDVQTVTGVAFNIMRNGRSQKDENEADEFGVRYMHAAGYKSKGMLEVFDVLSSLSKGASPPKLLSTHPPINERKANVNAVIKSLDGSQK